MYPLADSRLTLPEIAKHWVRDLPQHPPEAEILDYLIKSFWRGDFEPFASTSSGIIARRQALRAVAQSGPHPGLVICPAADSVPPSSVPTDDGGVTVDLTTYVVIPDSEENWSAKVLDAAYAILGTCSLSGFSENFVIGMRLQSLTKEQFGAFCDLRHHPRPGFWFSQPSERRPLSFGGRPSAMRLIEAELRRRAESAQLSPKLADEAKYLEAWGRDHLPPDLPAPKAKSICNAVRALFRNLHAAQNRPKT